MKASASPIALAALITAATPGEARADVVNAGNITVNNIVADGRTQTHIDVSGNLTSITTDTVSSGVGFNSFQFFQEAAGQRVDLYVPDQADALVNLVREGSVIINGELNAYKDGSIGGNVFFSSSDGFILGAEGVINVGSLTVNAPTRAFMEKVVRADGSVDMGVARQLMLGEIPISSSGLISIAGQINADGGILLQGHTVNIDASTGPVTGDDLDQVTKFNATVNNDDLQVGAALVSHGGTLAIVAEGDVSIGGHLDVSADVVGDGGKISVTSGGDILVSGTAQMSADGAGPDGSGGDIVVIASDTLSVEDQAQFTASGSGSGDGGFVELSGKLAEIGSLQVDLGSNQGLAGTLLIDPVDLLIGPSHSANILSVGANIILQADNSITIVNGGILDSTDGVATAGDITMEAPLITLQDGSQVLAGTTGDVTLTATQTGGGTAAIEIGQGVGAAPVVTGRNITLTASSTVDQASLLLALPEATATVTIDSANVTAAGTLTASATAEANGGVALLPIGVVVTNVLSAVDIVGSSVVSADNIDLSATSAVQSTIVTQSLAPSSSSADGAVAVATINSTARVRIGGTSQVTSTGYLNLTAMNTVVSVADATPQAAAFGASVGVSVVNVTTTSEIVDSADVSSASLALDATTSTDISVTAKAAEGGASDPQDGSEAKSKLTEYQSEASTSEGSVSVVGGLAVSDLTSTTSSLLSTSLVVDVTNALSVMTSSQNKAAVVADGSAVDSSTGVGVAVGINLADVSNDALIVSDVTAGSIVLSALSGAAGNVFSTIATSGAGASGVGVAGSLSVNLVDTQSLAQIATGATVVVTGGGAVSLTSDNQTETTAEALPVGGGASGDTVGVGASVAINIVANRSTAEVDDTATVSGVGDLTLSATAIHSATTTAEAGSSGGISVTPALGLSMINNTTMARLGTLASGTQVSSGSVLVSAAQQSTTTTSSSGKAAGSKAAVGASLALALIDDLVLATTARDISATNNVTFAAAGASSSTLTSTASASGGEAAEDDGSAPAGSKPDVDATVTDELSAGSAKQQSAGVGDSDQQASTSAGAADEDGRSASTSEGKVSVAAAVSVNVQNSSVIAVVPDGVVITSGGTLSLRTANNTLGKGTANGSAVGVEDESGETPPPSAVGIGAAVAVNVVKVKNDATLGVASHSVGGLDIAALKLDVAKLMANPASTGTLSDTYLASATSGAGGSKVGLAGSVAINLVDTQSLAQIASGSTVVVTGAGAVTLSADNQTETTAEALPVGGGASGDTVGIGASVAINIVANRSTAEVDDTATVSGVGDLTLSASAIHSATATAEAGSSGGVSLTPALGLSIINNTATARLGTLASGAQVSSGLVLVSAAQQSTTTTSASGEAAGSKAAIGASLALALIDDRVLATTARDVNATNSVTFAASGVSSSTLTSTASASGAAEGDDADAAPASTGPSVDKTTTTQLNAGAAKQQQSGVGDSSQQSATSSEASNESGRSAKTSEGKVSVAAAVSVNVQKSSVTASVPDGYDITAGGTLTIKSANNTNGSATSDGSAVKGEGDGSQVGIGVAVSVNVIKKTNTASLGDGTHLVNGVNVLALQALDSSDPTDEITAEATSGAGASKVGIAGSLALNLIDATTEATISGSATVDAGTGTSTVRAEQKMLATAKALPTDEGTSGGKVGVGASVALNFVDTSTSAMIKDGATFNNGTGLVVSASSDISTVTEASAGAAGGIAVDASVALAMLDETTIARVGTGSGLSMGSGAVTISASNIGTNSAKSTGENKSGKIGVGASAALILGSGDSDGVLENTSLTSAVLARDITAGSLSISASANRTYDAHATATSGGGEFSQSGDEKKNDTTGGSSTSANSIDKTKDSQRDSDGKKSGSKVTVAAAAGIAAAQDNVSATLGDVTVNVTGALDVTATNTTGMATSGNGSAVNSSSNISVGVGIGLGILNNTTVAKISDGATITHANVISVSATSRENADGAYRSSLTALGIAGAGGKKVSVAGALAVGISTGSTDAIIGDNVTISDGGAVSLSADNTSRLAAKAAAGSLASSGTGVGISIAVAVSDRDYAATIGANSSITADSLLVHAQNHKISAPASFDFVDLDGLRTQLESGQLLGENNYYVEAIGGSAGSKGSLQGSFAVLIFDDEVTASIGKSVSGVTNTATTISTGTGDVTIEAQNDFAAKAFSGAISLSGGSGAGLAGSVIVSSGTITSLLADNSSILSAGSFTSQATASQDIQAFGISVAAASSNAINGVATVITSQNLVQALMGVNASVNVGSNGAVKLAASNDFDTFSLAGGAAGGGSNALGASASVVTVENVTRAAMADGTSSADRAEINTGGTIEISATATEGGNTVAAAGAAAGSNAVGAGAGIYVLDTTTEALVGDYGKVGNSYTLGSTSIAASDITTLLGISGGAAGGGSAGAGAGASVGVIEKATRVEIGSSGIVDSGNVVLKAYNKEDLSLVSIAAGVGGTAGLAGAASVYSVDTTTEAIVDGFAKVHAEGNVAVLAEDHISVDLLDGSVAVGGTAGVGASVGVTLIEANTRAVINDDAEVTALGNRAAQVFVTDHNAQLVAYGSGDDFSSADVDRSEFEDSTGSETSLLTSDDARTQGLSLLVKNRVLNESGSTVVTKAARGVIVNAVGTTAVRSLSAGGAAAGTVAVSISASAAVITANTEALIGSSAKINQMAGGTANAAQSVNVAAASDIYTMGFAGAVAGGGTVGGGAGVSVVIVDATTTAEVDDNSVTDAKGDVLVSAEAKADFVGMAAAGAGAGVAALAGSGAAYDVTSTTTATLGGTVEAGGNVDVIAEDVTRTALLAGSVAIGGTAGIGAAINVGILDKTVTASIADNASVTALGNSGSRNVLTGSSFGGTTSAGGVNVEASSGQSVFILTVSGAGGLYAGISGVVSLDLMNVTTSAFIGANSLINTANGNAGSDSDQDVVVAARDTTVTSAAAGAVSAGLVGLSGAVDVGVFKNTTAAYIKDGATINARRDVLVSGLGNKAGETIVASGSGGVFALAAGIAVYNYGDGIAPGGEADSELSESSDGAADMDGINSDAQAQASNSQINDLLSSSDDDRVKDISASVQAKRTQIDVAGAAATLAVPGGTSASVGNSTISAGGSLNVNSSDKLAVEMTTGGFAVGGAAVGAGIGVLTVDTGSTAKIDGSGSTITAGAVNVKAVTDNNLVGNSYAGAGAGSIAVGADVAVFKDNSRTSAYIDGMIVVSTGGVAVNADGKRFIKVEGYGATLAGVAGVGASVTTADIGGKIEAYLKDTAISSSSSVEVKAVATDEARALAIAAGGGVGVSLQGAAALASVETTVEASVVNSQVSSTGLIDVSAEATTKAWTSATGVAVAGGLAVGGSDAQSDVEATVKTTVSGGSTLAGGSINISSALNSPTVQSFSSGSAGALVGVSATISESNNKSTSIVMVEGGSLISTGDVALAASSVTNQDANASGLAVGILAAGFNTSEATSNITTQATLEDMTSVQVGSLSITATGDDDNTADTVAGSGGVIAGSAASGTTSTISSTKAQALTSDSASSYNIVATGDVSIAATHTSRFSGSVDSTQASLVGASGANLEHTVYAVVDASVGDYANLYAKNLSLAAQNITHNLSSGFNVNSVSAGLANVPAGGATIDVTHLTTSSIGDNATVHILAPSSGISTLEIEASNDITVSQKVKLDSGGAIAIALADIDSTFNVTAGVGVGDDSEVIVDIGDIAMAAWGDADIDVRASATTYGLAGAPSGDANIVYNTSNTASVGSRTRLEASDGINPLDGSDPTHGTIDIVAGQRLNGTEADLKFNAIVDTFNKTAIPIPSAPDPTVIVTSNSVVTINPIDDPLYQGVRAAGDITISTSRGNIDARAVGTGKDLYREALAEVGSAISNAFGGGDVTFDYHGGTTLTSLGIASVVVNGKIQTGIQRHKQLTIDYSSSPCDTSTQACLAAPAEGEIGYSVSGPDPVGTEILERLSELKQLIIDYSSDVIAKAAYKNEIDFLENKLVALGLGTYDTGGNFVAGQYAGPSPKEAALVVVAQDEADIATVNNDLASTAGFNTGDLADSAGRVKLYYDGTTFGITDLKASAVALIDNLSTYASADTSYLTAANLALAAGQLASSSANTAKNNIIVSRDVINTKTAQIETENANLAAALLSGNTSAAATAQSTIANAKLAISTELAKIDGYTTTLTAQTIIARDKAAQVRANLVSLMNSAPLFTDSDATVQANTRAADQAIKNGLLSSTGSLTYLSSVYANFVSENTRIGTIASAIDSVLTTLQSTTTSAGTVGDVNNSLNQYVGLLGTLTTKLVADEQTASAASSSSGTPITFTIEVDDTLARLGNININADQLTGTGLLNAPTDAKILITNNTSNTLKLGKLIIPTYDAGHLRFNGVLISGNDDITSLNTTGATAAFTNINTQETAGSSRGLVQIISNYNSEDTSYYNPSSTSGLTHLTTRRVAPDIILKTGGLIENTNGAVVIDSASGNIYINGVINAGSVDIIARNGDFVSSYVNGFNHIGGDPASFNSPTRASEKGNGITANGHISIAARFLNINSTIQSGIADLSLALEANQLLTTADPGSIGLTDAEITQAENDYATAVGNGVSVSPIITLINSQGNAIKLNMAPEGVDPTELQTKIAAYQLAYSFNSSTSPVVTLSVDGVPTQVNIKDFISGNIQGRLEFTVSQAETYNNAAGGDGIFGIVSANSNLGAAYDAGNDQFIVNGASVNGGYIQLFGQIMNTASSGGELNVLDGFGTINVTNTSSIPLVLKSLSTGKDDTGTLRGTGGVIDITDVTNVNTSTASNPIVNVLHTVYTRDYDPANPGAAKVRIVQQSGTINSAGDIVYGGAETTSFGNNRTSTYDPTPYQRYVWTTGEKYQSITKYNTVSTNVFHSSDLTVAQVSNLTQLGSPSLLNIARLSDGTYVTKDRTQVGNDTILNTSNGVVIIANPSTQTNVSLVNTAYEFGSASYVTYNDLDNTHSSSSCNWWTLCIASDVTDYYTLTQKYTTIVTESLKADYPIAINFIGSDVGTINVNSNAGVALTGTLYNVAGTTTINATGAGSSIEQANLAASISATTINLNAGGYIGGVPTAAFPGASVDLAVSVMLNGAAAGNGSLSATAGDGNVEIISRGDLIVDQVTASGVAANNKGNVSLVSYLDISGKDTGALIQGARVALTAISGSIGDVTDGNLLHVNTGFTSDPADRPFGDPLLDPSILTNTSYGLSATAAGDIGIHSTGWSENADGTMLVDQVLSLGGDVRLASTGYILDNNPSQYIDSRTYDQLLGYWESLGLLAQDASRGINGTDNADKLALTIQSYKNGKEQQYQQYWTTRNMQADPATFDPAFTVQLDTSSAQYLSLVDYYSNQVTDQNPGFNQAQIDAAVVLKIADFEQQKTDEYRSLNDTIGGLTSVYVDGYDYIVSQGEKDQLTGGGTWTERELAFSLAPGALKTVTGTNPVKKDPNVSGRTVTIEAGLGIGETIGQGTASPGVSIRSSTDPRDLTMDQKVALAAAERSDLLLTVGVIELPTNPTDEQIAAFDAAAIFGLTSGTPLTEIELGKDFDDLSAIQQAALSAAAVGLVSAQNTLLTVLSKRPLNFNAATELNVSVPNVSDPGNRDVGVAYLASEGSAVLGTIDTYGETRIKVRGDINNAAAGSSVSTGTLVLEASQGGIGNQAPLQLDLRAAAAITARAQNGVNLSFLNDGLIDTVYSPGSVNLTAGGSLLNANDDLLLNIFATNVVLDASNGSIGTVVNPLNVAVNLGGGITATAMNEVNLYGPLGFKFIIDQVTSTNGGSISLIAAEESIINGLVETAGTITLTAGGRLVLTNLANVHSVAGNITIQSASLKMLNGSQASADAGRVEIMTMGDALVTGITAGSADVDAVSIQAGGSVFAGTLDPRVDITAMTAGAGVTIVAGLGIGDMTQANDKASDEPGDVPGSANAITDVHNPLRILTNTLDATAQDGDIDVIALGDIVFTNLQAHLGSIDAFGAGTMDITLAVSGGSQNFTATDDLSYVQLTTTGLPSDEGDINLTSINGHITGGNLKANGSNTIIGGNVVFGTIEVGNTSTIRATGDITGDSQIAGNIIDNFAGFGGGLGSMAIGNLQAPNIFLEATGTLTLPKISVAERLALRADIIEATITQEPDGPNPLELTVEGALGRVATLATLTVNAPAGIVMPELRVVDTTLDTTAEDVSILSAYVPGSLRLTTPVLNVHVDNRTPAPQPGSDVQIYDKDFAFDLYVKGAATATNGIVVQYNVNPDSTDVVPLDLLGISLVRDSVRNILQVDRYPYVDLLTEEPSAEEEEKIFEGSDVGKIDVGGIGYQIVYVTGDGPAVLLRQVPQDGGGDD